MNLLGASLSKLYRRVSSENHLTVHVYVSYLVPVTLSSRVTPPSSNLIHVLNHSGSPLNAVNFPLKPYYYVYMM